MKNKRCILYFVLEIVFCLSTQLWLYIFIYLIEFIQIRLDKWPLRLQLILTRFLMGNACDHQRKRNWINITKFPIPFHAQEKLLVLIIVVEMTSNFRQEIRYSYYRNDPVKYDLKHLLKFQWVLCIQMNKDYCIFLKKIIKNIIIG